MFGCLAAAAVAGGFMDRRGAASAQRLCGDLRALLRVKTAEPRVKCGGVPSADARGRGAYRTAGAGDEALLFALRSWAKSAGRQSASATFRGRRAFRELRLRIALAALNPRPANIFPPAGRGACGGRDIYAFLVLRRRCDNGGGVRGERAHAHYGLHILLGHAAVSCGGGIYIGRRAGYPRKTGSEKKP